MVTPRRARGRVGRMHSRPAGARSSLSRYALAGDTRQPATYREPIAPGILTVLGEAQGLVYHIRRAPLLDRLRILTEIDMGRP